MVGFLSHRKYIVMSTISVRAGVFEEREPTVGQPPSLRSLDGGSRSHLGRGNEFRESSINATGFEKVANGSSYLLARLLDLL
jgi:hypothetical protein